MNQITFLLMRLLLLPVTLVMLLLRLIGRLLGRLMRPVLAAVDRSESLSRLINSLSSSMATQRGLLLMIGTVLVVLSLLAHVMVLAIVVSAGDFNGYLYLLCLPFALLHVGVLSGFIGIMLAVPLGQGYKSQQQ